MDDFSTDPLRQAARKFLTRMSMQNTPATGADLNGKFWFTQNTESVFTLDSRFDAFSLERTQQAPHG
ncbi:unnamed protein product [Fusarium graminearum]|nr:unnamed protein product [Fusarium graminearum]CAG1977619.1 unnamed protein product [Fusarium graminearum]VTO86619.1 unnamed protein product [Fusarium graminearum]